jgi:hypothetical protein
VSRTKRWPNSSAPSVSLLLKHFKRTRRQLKTKKSVRGLCRRKRLLPRDKRWQQKSKRRLYNVNYFKWPKGRRRKPKRHKKRSKRRRNATKKNKRSKPKLPYPLGVKKRRKCIGSSPSLPNWPRCQTHRPRGSPPAPQQRVKRVEFLPKRLSNHQRGLNAGSDAHLGHLLRLLQTLPTLLPRRPKNAANMAGWLRCHSALENSAQIDKMATQLPILVIYEVSIN